MKKISAILLALVFALTLGFTAEAETPSVDASQSIFTAISVTVTDKDVITSGGRHSTSSCLTVFFKNETVSGSAVVDKQQYALISVGDEITVYYPTGGNMEFDQYTVFMPTNICYVTDVRRADGKYYAVVNNCGTEMTIRIGEGMSSPSRLTPGTAVNLRGKGDKTYIEGWSVAGNTIEMIFMLTIVCILGLVVIGICVTHIIVDIKDEIELRREQKHKKTVSAYRGW